MKSFRHSKSPVSSFLPRHVNAGLGSMRLTTNMPYTLYGGDIRKYCNDRESNKKLIEDQGWRKDKITLHSGEQADLCFISQSFCPRLYIRDQHRSCCRAKDKQSSQRIP